MESSYRINGFNKRLKSIFEYKRYKNIFQWVFTNHLMWLNHEKSRDTRGFCEISDPSCQRLTPFLERKGKSNGIRHQKNAKRLHAGF